MKSSKARKQRRELFNLPLHRCRKHLTAQLSKELQKQHNRKRLPIRKGDEVEVLRGQHKKKRGPVHVVELKRMKILVKNVTQKKNDGSEVMLPMDASNLRIVKLDMEDAKRLKASAKVEAKKKVDAKPAKEEKPKKPEAKPKSEGKPTAKEEKPKNAGETLKKPEAKKEAKK